MLDIYTLLAGGSGIVVGILSSPLVWMELAEFRRGRATWVLHRREIQAAEAQRRAADQVREKMRRPVRVLVINDDDDLLELCRLILEGEGHDVETTTDASAVSAAVARFQPNAIVLDWRLQDRTGGQVLQELQARFTSPPPVLVISSLDHVKAQAIQRGAQAFLRKPFDNADLAAAVDALVKGGPTG